MNSLFTTKTPSYWYRDSYYEPGTAVRFIIGILKPVKWCVFRGPGLWSSMHCEKHGSRGPKTSASVLSFCPPRLCFYHTLQWRHNGRDGLSNHQPHDCLLNRLFWHRSKKISKLRVTGLCARNSPVTGEFPAQRTSNAENVSIWWRHHSRHGGGGICHVLYTDTRNPLYT